MARKPRFNIVGVPQHVIQRGNNREACFFAVFGWTASGYEYMTLNTANSTGIGGNVSNTLNYAIDHNLKSFAPGPVRNFMIIGNDVVNRVSQEMFYEASSNR